MNLGKAIKLCRTQRGLTQIKLANLAEISVSYLSLLEQGKRDPTFSTIERIADGLKIPIIMLVFLAEDGEVHVFDKELREKLSYAALRLIKEE